MAVGLTRWTCALALGLALTGAPARAQDEALTPAREARRLSIGIEDPADLVADLARALESLPA